MSNATIEKWSANGDYAHVHLGEIWKDSINSTYSDVVELPLEQVVEFAQITGFVNEEAQCCDRFCNQCWGMVHLISGHGVPLARTQLERVSEQPELIGRLTDNEVTYLLYKATEYRKQCGEYAQDPFIDPIPFDADEIWMQIMDYLEKRFPEFQREEI